LALDLHAEAVAVQADSRFLDSAVAVAPTTLGMTRLKGELERKLLYGAQEICEVIGVPFGFAQGRLSTAWDRLSDDLTSLRMTIFGQLPNFRMTNFRDVKG
jgi:hypothetical protein